MLELATAKNPWPEIQSVGELIMKMCDGVPPELPSGLSPLATDFIE